MALNLLFYIAYLPYDTVLPETGVELDTEDVQTTVST
jgi:hypothetical protein